MSGKFSLDDYVDVAERIASFYERFPDGRLTRQGDPTIMEIGGKTFVVYTALAYRTPDDPVPALGTSWEPFPGGTPYTRDSELMNAETAAWGRAIVAAGFATKKIASRQEVRARQDMPVVTDVQRTDVQRTGVSDVTPADPWVDAIKTRAVPFAKELRSGLESIGVDVPVSVSSWGRVLAGLDARHRELFASWLTVREEQSADVPWVDPVPA